MPNQALVDAMTSAFPSNLPSATAGMNLTPQEQALYAYHLRNLYGQGKVENPNGSISTIYQAVVPHAGRYFNIPTVWDGKITDVPEAIKRASAEGWQNWPSYPSPQVADSRYSRMHEYMGEDTYNWAQRRNP